VVVYEEQYPEHTKLVAVSAESQIIGEFLEWAQSEGHLFLGRETISGLLAGFFRIDEQKLETEKQDLLETVRYLSSLQSAGTGQSTEPSEILTSDTH
jgi:hypothetical protein